MKTLLLILSLAAAEAFAGPETTPSQTTLQSRLDAAVLKTLRQFEGVKTNELAVTAIQLRRDGGPVQAAYRGDVPIYPASVVKLFYLVAAHQWMEEGKLKDTEELRRAMRDMIVDSYNEATHYVLDVLTGTTSGPELPPEELAQWAEKRDAVNRYFQSRGYAGINVNKKPWCEGPYGREVQAIKAFKPNRNLLTADATARLLSEIANGKAVSAKRSAEMLQLLERDPFRETKDPDDQAHGFSGPAIPRGSKLWSKAGWTSETRHDAVYLELPGGERLVFVIFTVNHSEERKIIPFIAGEIIHSVTPAP